MEVDYDAVNESINESIMEEIGGMNAFEFVESIAGKNLPNDHDIGNIVMNMSDNSFIDRDSMSVNDVLDYLGENYNTASEDSPYGSFLGIVTRELDRRFDERSR